jgi:hypothetical protein
LQHLCLDLDITVSGIVLVPAALPQDSSLPLSAA